MAGGGSGGSTQPPGVLRWPWTRWGARWPSFLGEEPPLLDPSAVQASLPCSELALLQPVNVVAELKGRPQLQTHVLHHRVTSQQEQGLAIDLVFAKEVSMGSKLGISFPDKLHHILNRPRGGVPAT